MATPTGVALLAELEGMAQRHMPKKQAEPIKPVSQFLSSEEVKAEFLRDKRPNTYANLQKVLANRGLEVFFKRKELARE